MNNFWAMELCALKRYWLAISTYEKGDIEARSREAARPGAGFALDGGTAVIPVRGVLHEGYSAIADLLGYEQTAPSAIAANIKRADADDSVSRIVLDVNSPGGVVDGIPMAAQAVAGARKPIEARITGTGASAAYWIASQADQIVATPEADVGSIGVYTVVYDESEMAADAGVRVHVISSGPHKGAGTPGTALTPEQAEALQQNVNATADLFVDAVAQGRGVAEAEAREWASGRTWIATTAMSLGLVDRIDDGGAAMARTGRAPRTKGGQKMAEHNEGQAPAPGGRNELERWRELKAAFPLEFAAGQFEAGATVAEAKAAYGEVLADELAAAKSAIETKNAELAAKDEEIAGLKQKLESAQADPVKTGAKPLEGSARDVGIQGTGFWSIVEAHMAEGLPRHKAIPKAARENKELHEAWVTSQRSSR